MESGDSYDTFDIIDYFLSLSEHLKFFESSSCYENCFVFGDVSYLKLRSSTIPTYLLFRVSPDLSICLSAKLKLMIESLSILGVINCFTLTGVIESQSINKSCFIRGSVFNLALAEWSVCGRRLSYLNRFGLSIS